LIDAALDVAKLSGSAQLEQRALALRR